VWLSSFNAEPMPLGRFTRIWSDGVYVNKPGYHGSGRAVDLHYFDTAGTSRAFNADYGVWRNWTGTALTDVRKRYWAIASSLHYDFTYVLTYLYNQEHWTHIHVDDGVSRSSGTRFDTDCPRRCNTSRPCARTSGTADDNGRCVGPADAGQQQLRVRDQRQPHPVSGHELTPSTTTVSAGIGIT
jgi:hypothetical protein